MDEPIKAGKSKQIQLEKWKEYFDYRQVGYKIRIIDVYKTQKPKISTKYGYIELLEEIILDVLSQPENKGNLFLSKNKLFRCLSMVNDNYNFGRYNILKLSKLINIEEDDIREFYDLSSSTFKRSVDNALSKLSNKSLVFWSSVMTVCELEADVDKNERGKIDISRIPIGIDEYEEDSYKYGVDYNIRKRHRAATQEEIRGIIKIEREVMNILNCTSKQDVLKKSLWQKYSTMIKNRLWDQYNVLFYYESYNIISDLENITDIHKEIDKRRLSSIQDNISKDLNKQTISKLNKNATNRYVKAKTKNSVKRNSAHARRRSRSYIKDHKVMSNMLIGEYKDIRKDILLLSLGK